MVVASRVRPFAKVLNQDVTVIREVHTIFAFVFSSCKRNERRERHRQVRTYVLLELLQLFPFMLTSKLIYKSIRWLRKERDRNIPSWAFSFLL